MNGIVKMLNISIHSPHARGDYRRIMDFISHDISIHSPHARGDMSVEEQELNIFISIHSPHARGNKERQRSRASA